MPILRASLWRVLKYMHALRLLLVFKVDTHKKGSDATRTHFFFSVSSSLCGPCPHLQAFLFYLPVTQCAKQSIITTDMFACFSWYRLDDLF